MDLNGLNIQGSYRILLFTASDLASITSHMHRWVLFLLWLRLFILSGVISPLISSSIVGTYWPGEFLFQYPIILPFHTVHGVLKARILKWFAIPFSSGPHSVRLKLKKVGKTTRPFRYDLNQIPYDYTVEVRNRFKELDLIECLMNYGLRFMTFYGRQGSRPSPWKRNAKKQNGCMRRPYK